MTIDFGQYSMHPGLAMEEAALRLLKERTGADLETWVARVRGANLADGKVARHWLKGEGLTANYAMWVADRAAGIGGAQAYDPVALVAAQFNGNRVGLRPLYDRLLGMALAVGPDVKACPGKTIVPLYRDRVFAQIKVGSASRIDLGLALGALPADGRLIDTGGFANRDRITHRIPVSSAEEIDADVERWLAHAYELG